MTAEEYINRTDKKIAELREKGRTKILDVSLPISHSDMQKIIDYYTKKGFNFEARLCPRKLYDIIIIF